MQQLDISANDEDIKATVSNYNSYSKAFYQNYQQIKRNNYTAWFTGDSSSPSKLVEGNKGVWFCTINEALNC